MKIHAGFDSPRWSEWVFGFCLDFGCWEANIGFGPWGFTVWREFEYNLDGERIDG